MIKKISQKYIKIQAKKNRTISIPGLKFKLRTYNNINFFIIYVSF